MFQILLLKNFIFGSFPFSLVEMSLIQKLNFQNFFNIQEKKSSCHDFFSLNITFKFTNFLQVKRDCLGENFHESTTSLIITFRKIFAPKLGTTEKFWKASLFTNFLLSVDLIFQTVKNSCLEFFYYYRFFFSSIWRCL